MTYKELTQEQKNNVKKYIKEELLSNQKVKLPINPNEFTYSFNKGLQVHGKLKNMDDNQLRSTVIRNVKFGLK